MSFGNNVMYYRKKYGITQEELAEKMELTRQTVSRWETDSAFPEMEKLVQLCEIFRCDMDTLVRGDAAKNDKTEDGAKLREYDKHMNAFTAVITAGVCLVLSGVSALLFISSALGSDSVFGVVALLGCVAVAVSLFIAGGINHESFIKESPRPEKYPEADVKSFRRKMPYLIAVPTALIFIGIIILIVLNGKEGYAPAGFTAESWELFSVGVFMSAVTVAVGIYVSAGMLFSKYDIGSAGSGRTDGITGDGENSGDAGAGGNVRARKGERISSACCGVIMMLCAIIFLLSGFLFNLWHPGWVVFPVGGILCGIVSVITEAVFGKVKK